MTATPARFDRESARASSPRRAVVLLSGGMDSAVSLALAREQGFECHALSLDYGQRHRAELHAAERIAREVGAASHRTIALDLRAFGGSALTADIEVPDAIASGARPGVADCREVDTAAISPVCTEVGSAAAEHIPVTYVPARNTIMLSLALGWAEVLDASAIFLGVNAVDYSGYPDCRPQFIAAFQRMADLATRAGVEGHGVQIQAPLIDLSKAQIITEGLRLGVDFSHTVTCYRADDRGQACARCDACALRREGFEAANLPDATRYITQA